MSLAEELLADLEDDEDEELQEESAAAAGGELETEITAESAARGNGVAAATTGEERMDVDSAKGTENTLEAVVKYYNSPELKGGTDRVV